jgi:hypothetical protein
MFVFLKIQVVLTGNCVEIHDYGSCVVSVLYFMILGN